MKFDVVHGALVDRGYLRRKSMHGHTEVVFRVGVDLVATAVDLVATVFQAEVAARVVTFMVTGLQVEGGVTVATFMVTMATFMATAASSLVRVLDFMPTRGGHGGGIITILPDLITATTGVTMMGVTMGEVTMVGGTMFHTIPRTTTAATLPNSTRRERFRRPLHGAVSITVASTG